MPCHCLVTELLTRNTAACQDVEDDLLALPLVQASRTFLRLS